jgi:hypothetical protein
LRNSFSVEKVSSHSVGHMTVLDVRFELTDKSLEVLILAS